MRGKSFFFFQRGESDYYALSDTLHCKRQLPRDVGEGTWHFLRRFDPTDLADYIQALEFLNGRSICILRLRIREGKSVFECCGPTNYRYT